MERPIGAFYLGKKVSKLASFAPIADSKTSWQSVLFICKSFTLPLKIDYTTSINN